MTSRPSPEAPHTRATRRCVCAAVRNTRAAANVLCAQVGPAVRSPHGAVQRQVARRARAAAPGAARRGMAGASTRRARPPRNHPSSASCAALASSKLRDFAQPRDFTQPFASACACAATNTPPPPPRQLSTEHAARFEARDRRRRVAGAGAYAGGAVARETRRVAGGVERVHTEMVEGERGTLVRRITTIFTDRCSDRVVAVAVVNRGSVQ